LYGADRPLNPTSSSPRRAADAKSNTNAEYGSLTRSTKESVCPAAVQCEPTVSREITGWSMVARCQLLDPKCRPARARKNYWRLYARYPEIAKIAARLSLTPLSA